MKKFGLIGATKEFHEKSNFSLLLRSKTRFRDQFCCGHDPINCSSEIRLSITRSAKRNRRVIRGSRVVLSNYLGPIPYGRRGKQTSSYVQYNADLSK